MDSNKETALVLLKKIYSLVKHDQCVVTDDAVAMLRKMSTRDLNKTEAADYLGIAVSTFNKLLASGAIPPGTKRANECLKWNTDVLDEYIETHRNR